jgi:beta-galactosidase GanA
VGPRRKPVTDIGVLRPEEFDWSEARRIPPAALDAIRMLTEAALQFDILDSASDLSRYKLVILPDRIPADAALTRKVDAYVSAGGSLLASYESGLAPEGDRFAIRSLGLEYKGDAPYSPDFLVTDGPLAAGLPNTELVMYMKSKLVAPAAGTTVLMRTHVPYFNRTWDHFFSHRHNALLW